MDSYNQDMFSTPEYQNKMTTSGVIGKTIIGLVLTIAIMGYCLVSGFGIDLGIIGFILILLLPFLYSWLAQKTLKTTGTTQVLFWLGSIISMGLFEGLCLTNLIGVMSYYAPASVVESLDSILGLALVVTIGVSIGGLLMVPKILKNPQMVRSFTKFGTILANVSIGVSIVILVLAILGLLFSFLGNTTLIDTYIYLIAGINPISILITVFFLVVSVVLFMQNLVAVGEYANNKDCEYFASFLIISGMVEIFYWVVKLILQLFLMFGNNDDN